MGKTEDKPEVRIHIGQFNPLEVTIPKVEGSFVGKVKIVLPDVHMQLYDLSMGIDLLKGAHIGADGPAFSVDMDVPEPGVTRAQMMEMILAAEEAQGELDKAGAILDKK
jgi:hypothetical protein